MLFFSNFQTTRHTCCVIELLNWNIEKRRKTLILKSLSKRVRWHLKFPWSFLTANDASAGEIISSPHIWCVDVKTGSFTSFFLFSPLPIAMTRPSVSGWSCVRYSTDSSSFVYMMMMMAWTPCWELKEAALSSSSWKVFLLFMSSRKNSVSTFFLKTWRRWDSSCGSILRDWPRIALLIQGDTLLTLFII